MIESKSFLQELDEAVLRGSAESREKALWYVTDTLIVGRFTEDEIWIFGEVIGRLAEAIEIAARAQLAKRLARGPMPRSTWSRSLPSTILSMLRDRSLSTPSGSIRRR